MSKWILEGGIRINRKTNTREVVCDACNLMGDGDNAEIVLPGDLVRKTARRSCAIVAATS